MSPIKRLLGTPTTVNSQVKLLRLATWNRIALIVFTVRDLELWPLTKTMSILNTRFREAASTISTAKISTCSLILKLKNQACFDNQ